MPKRQTPITIFTANAAEAISLAAQDTDSRAMTTGPGTLKFHALIAQHGAGEFKTLYAPLSMRPLWQTPAGGEVRIIRKGT